MDSTKKKLTDYGKLLFVFGLLFIFIFPYFVDRPKIQGELPNEFHLEFNGLKNEFNQKENIIKVNNPNKVRIIWEELSKMNHIFRSSIRGSVWRLKVIPQGKQETWTNKIYLYKIENEYIFLNRNSHYKNDSLANYLMLQFEIDSIRILDKYKIETRQ